jgi:NAD(P)H-nitrite reductase large subunit
MPDSPKLTDDERLICFCHNVTAGRIREAIRGGATTHTLIQEKTCASTGCGGCTYDVLEVLQQLIPPEADDRS